MRGEIMYVENKSDPGPPAWIARVTRTRSGRGVCHAGRLLQPIQGGTLKSNHMDTETGDEYWVSRPRRDGQDRLYPGTVEIDDDVREEYWTAIRRRPDRVGETTFRSEGKYSSRRVVGTMRRDRRPPAATATDRSRRLLLELDPGGALEIHATSVTITEPEIAQTPAR
jgi:hypothetical protein